MASYCKKCLKMIAEGQEMCQECLSEARRKKERQDKMKSTYDKFTSFTSKQVKKARKACIRCGKPLGLSDSLLASFESGGIVCKECILREKQRQHRIRVEGMKEGKSFIIIERKNQLANAVSTTKITLYNVNKGNSVIANLDDGESTGFLCPVGGQYMLKAKIAGWKESNQLTIDVSKGETVYIQITSKSGGNPAAIAYAMATRMDMVFCKIIKREYIENGVVKTISI